MSLSKDFSSDYLSIKAEINAEPFITSPERDMIAKWCSANDSIVPIFMSREDWVRKMDKNPSLLEPRSDKKKSLFLPYDLSLAELVPIVYLVDNDTYGNDVRPALEHKSELVKFGKNMMSHAIYLANNVDPNVRGIDIASSACVDMYNYGETLVGRSEIGGKDFATIREMHINDVTQKECDSWFFGEGKDVISSEYRSRKISQYFRVLDSARKIEDNSSEQITYSKAYRDKFFTTRWVDNQRFVIRSELRTPMEELYKSVLRRGLYKLSHEIKDKHFFGYDMTKSTLRLFGYDIDEVSPLLANKINIHKMRADLEEVRESGDKRKIGNMERKIAGRIQRALSKFAFSYTKEGDLPSQIVKDQRMDCFGFVALGAAMFESAGLNHCVGQVSVSNSEFAGGWAHYCNILITEDAHEDESQIFDMQSAFPINIKSRNLLRTDDLVGGEQAIKQIYSLVDKPHQIINTLIQKQHPWIIALMAAGNSSLNKDSIAFSIGSTEEMIDRGLLTILLDHYSRAGQGKHLGVIGIIKDRLRAMAGSNPNECVTQATYSTDINERISLYKKALVYDPNSIVTYLELAEEYKKIGDIGQFEALTKKAESLTTWSAKSWQYFHKYILGNLKSVTSELQRGVKTTVRNLIQS